MKEDIGDSYFWASVDETTDRCVRNITNIVAGKLDTTGPSSPHLIASRVLEGTNSSTIARVVRDSLRVLWPSENNDEKFMALLTDSVAYMLNAGASLKLFCQKLIHITCLAHAVHIVAEHIRSRNIWIRARSGYLGLGEMEGTMTMTMTVTVTITMHQPLTQPFTVDDDNDNALVTHIGSHSRG
uniref:DUF659 domain-containing protein n=1 Tax=Timema genevievae TaxID=629358 RepID=A0A7R9K4U0_TIMGE|nr:unnamed protein product [Timema genevievae]